MPWFNRDNRNNISLDRSCRTMHVGCGAGCGRSRWVPCIAAGQVFSGPHFDNFDDGLETHGGRGLRILELLLILREDCTLRRSQLTFWEVAMCALRTLCNELQKQTVTAVVVVVGDGGPVHYFFACSRKCRACCRLDTHTRKIAINSQHITYTVETREPKSVPPPKAKYTSIYRVAFQGFLLGVGSSLSSQREEFQAGASVRAAVSRKMI